MTQASLLCGCGASFEGGKAEVCPRCRERARLNRRNFDGRREAALQRDEFQCQVCGEISPAQLVVHHRQRYNHVRYLVTLCRACHVRAHRLYSPSAALVSEAPFLYALWRELHRRQPEQLLLSGPKPLQKVLFANAG